MSGRGYARQIPQWRGEGYKVTLIFLSLPDAETAIARVTQRVRQGGHHIPDDVIRRRLADQTGTKLIIKEPEPSTNLPQGAEKCADPDRIASEQSYR